MDLILVAVISLGAIGLIAAVILYAASKKFAVYEDPRIAKVSEVLPQANCGGCGYPGCSGFAGACVKAADAGSLEGKLCPVGGAPVMEIPLFPQSVQTNHNLPKGQTPLHP